MRIVAGGVVLVLMVLTLAGCDGTGSSSRPANSQAVFYHNNRQHQQWVKNPGKKPDFRNPSTGGKMFY